MVKRKRFANYLIKTMDLFFELLPLTMAARLFATGLILLFVGLTLWVQGV